MNHFRILCSEMDAIHHWSSIHEQCFDYMNRYWVQRKDQMDVKMFMMLILYHLLNGRMKCSNQIQNY